MKRLYLMRHAKAEHECHCADIDRPLTPRGEKDARRTAKFLSETDFLPDKIISSPALRAKTTAEIFAKHAGNAPDLLVDQSLYSTTADAYINCIKSRCGSSESIMLVGHCPVIEDLLSILISEQGAIIKTPMPTAAIACLEAEIESWQNISPGLFSLEWLLIPKLLK